LPRAAGSSNVVDLFAEAMQVTFGLYANAARRCDAVQEEEKRRAECTNKMLLCCRRRMGKVELWGCIGNRPPDQHQQPRCSPMQEPTDGSVRTSHHMPFGLDTPIDL
jgi:hypothetical protein